MKRLLLGLLFLILAGLFVSYLWIKNINNYKLSGEVLIENNIAPIKIQRDEYGMSYVIADSKPDAIRGQGYVEAQDRLFQLSFYRAIIKGELASILGPSMLQSDIQMRVLNLTAQAKKNYIHLNQDSKNFLSWYCEGFNAYLNVGAEEWPKELDMLGMQVTYLTPEEVLAFIHFIGYSQAQNMNDEILSLNLSAHMKNADLLRPLNLNPDRTGPLSFLSDSVTIGESIPKSIKNPSQPNSLLPKPELGSNNWAIASSKSKSGKPILANDPHLDARLLPGIFYPIGLFCPEFRCVGVSLPGIPGIISGRNENVAFGVTNGYGDSQDLFIERIDRDSFLYKGVYMPLKTRREVIKVKDSTDVEIVVRSTIRGPIISDFESFGIMTDDDVCLRTSQAYARSASLGLERFMEAKNIDDFSKALYDIDNMFFNYVMADSQGGIAHQSTGLVPKRLNNNGSIPGDATIRDTWAGFVPSEELPGTKSPSKGWVGTANHDTRPDDYAYYYSSHFAPYYRYKRIIEMMEGKDKLDAQEMWNLVIDCKNKQAETLAPIFAKALATQEDTKELANALESWNYQDKIDQVEPTIYHTIYYELVDLILNDELPDDLESSYWGNQYYWQQRIDNMILDGEHVFIDNISTEEKESLESLIIEAGQRAKKILEDKLGSRMNAWTWGKVHQVTFSSPLRQEGIGHNLLGGEVIPKNGSNHTINRGGYNKTVDKNFDTGWFSTFRMVADLSDDDKIMGSLSGGSAARVFHPYYRSQLNTWKREEWIPYWISVERIEEHARHTLVLK